MVSKSSYALRTTDISSGGKNFRSGDRTAYSAEIFGNNKHPMSHYYTSMKLSGNADAILESSTYQKNYRILTSKKPQMKSKRVLSTISSVEARILNALPTVCVSIAMVGAMSLIRGLNSQDLVFVFGGVFSLFTFGVVGAVAQVARKYTFRNSAASSNSKSQGTHVINEC